MGTSSCHRRKNISKRFSTRRESFHSRYILTSFYIDLLHPKCLGHGRPNKEVRLNQDISAVPNPEVKLNQEIVSVVLMVRIE